MTTYSCFLFAYMENLLAIHIERFNCGSTCWSNTHKKKTIPSKVVRPTVTARVEQRNFCSGHRVFRFNARPFPKGTRDTGKGKVFHNRSPTNKSGHDMINMKRRFLSGL